MLEKLLESVKIVGKVTGKAFGSVGKKIIPYVAAATFAVGGCKGSSGGGTAGSRLVSLAGGDVYQQVLNQNPPAIISDPITAVRPTADDYAYYVEGRDPDAGDTLTFSLTSNTDSAAISGGLRVVAYGDPTAPPWLIGLSPNTSALLWEYGGSRPIGAYNVEVEVADSTGMTDTQQFVLNVMDDYQFDIQGNVFDEMGNPVSGVQININGFSGASKRGAGDPNDPGPIGTYFIQGIFGGLAGIDLSGGVDPAYVNPNPLIFGFYERTGLYAPVGGTINRDFIVFSRAPIDSSDPVFASVVGVQSIVPLFKMLTATDGSNGRSRTTRWSDSSLSVPVWLNEGGLVGLVDNEGYDSSNGLVAGANGVHDNIDRLRDAIARINSVVNPIKGANLFAESFTEVDSVNGRGVNVYWKGSLSVPGSDGLYLLSREDSRGMLYGEIEFPDAGVLDRNVALHEILHAAGLLGHSPDSAHIMYNDPKTSVRAGDLSADESRVLGALYRLKERTNMDNYRND